MTTSDEVAAANELLKKRSVRPKPLPEPVCIKCKHPVGVLVHILTCDEQTSDGAAGV